jgi:hypothetical protein
MPDPSSRPANPFSGILSEHGGLLERQRKCLTYEAIAVEFAMVP